MVDDITAGNINADDGSAEDIGLCALMRAMAAGTSVPALLAQAQGVADSAGMLMRMAQILDLAQLDGMPLLHDALRLRQHYRATPGGAAPDGAAALRLLVILKPGFMLDNTPVELLLEGSDIAIDLFYLAPDAPLPAIDRLPPHDVVLVAIAQFERNQAWLQQAVDLLQDLPASTPVWNLPRPGWHVERDRLGDLLQGIPGMLVPVTARMSRQSLASGGHPAFPLVIRPVVSYGGIGLARLESRDALLAYLARQEGETFFVAPYIDYRSDDGLYRKCRIALMRGRPLVCHLAISDHWIVHYQTAGMERDAARRDEEASFMAGFDSGFGARHAAALAAISERTGLDYVVVDCAELGDGRLLFFEADNSSVVHAMDAADMFPYKQVQMRKVREAFRAMLLQVPCR